MDDHARAPFVEQVMLFPNSIVILHQIVKVGKGRQLSAPPSLRRSPIHGADLTMSCARPRVLESLPRLNFFSTMQVKPLASGSNGANSADSEMGTEAVSYSFRYSFR
jgi:hypothetical protein